MGPYFIVVGDQTFFETVGRGLIHLSNTGICHPQNMQELNEAVVSGTSGQSLPLFIVDPGAQVPVQPSGEMSGERVAELLSEKNFMKLRGTKVIPLVVVDDEHHPALSADAAERITGEGGLMCSKSKISTDLPKNVATIMETQIRQTE